MGSAAPTIGAAKAFQANFELRACKESFLQGAFVPIRHGEGRHPVRFCGEMVDVPVQGFVLPEVTLETCTDPTRSTGAAQIEIPPWR